MYQESKRHQSSCHPISCINTFSKKNKAPLAQEVLTHHQGLYWPVLRLQSSAEEKKRKDKNKEISNHRSDNGEIKYWNKKHNLKENDN